MQISGLESQDLDSLDDSFDLDGRASTTSTVTQDPIVDQDPILQSHKRFKTTNDDAVNRLKAQNTETTTNRQTKWAIQWLKHSKIFVTITLLTQFNI